MDKSFTIRLGKVKVRKQTPAHLARTKTHNERGNTERREARALEREFTQEGPDLDI